MRATVCARAVPSQPFVGALGSGRAPRRGKFYCRGRGNVEESGSGACVHVNVCVNGNGRVDGCAGASADEGRGRSESGTGRSANGAEREYGGSAVESRTWWG